MNKEEIVARILKSGDLPTLPNVASRLITLTSREDTTLDDIGALVSQDISLSAKLLKITNSAFYSFPQKVGSVNQAVRILGMNAVRSLVLSFSFLSMKAGRQKSIFDFRTFWEHSLSSAVAAKFILEHVENANTEEIFVSALLQNIGDLILAKVFPAEYNEALMEIEKGRDSFEVEKEIFGLTHAEVGAAVTREWGFPDKLILPIEYHHFDPREYKVKDKRMKQSIAAVYLSKLLTQILFASENPQELYKQFRSEARKLLHLDAASIEDILNNIHIRFQEAGEYFDFKVKNIKSVQEILQEANIRLSLINLDYDQINKQLVQAKINLEKLTKELQEKNSVLANLANIDGLTGVFNHRYFQNSLKKEVERSTRTESDITLLLTDIDFFKKFNDTYGHQVGDFILTEFSRVIADNVRKYDIVARYGGEEFVIFLPETNLETGLLVGEKLRSLIDEHVFTDGQETYHVTASFGVSSAHPASMDNFSSTLLISHADTALYDAKEKGRNRVVPYVESKKRWFKF